MNADDLLRRALEALDWGDFPTSAVLYQDIRDCLETPKDKSVQKRLEIQKGTKDEPVEFKFESTGKELFRYYFDEDCIETKVEFAKYPVGSKFYPSTNMAPVAWRLRLPQKSVWHFHDDAEAVEALQLKGWIVKPLYIHPPRPMKPMTDEEIAKNGRIPPGEWDVFEMGVRFAERHHGIGGSDE